MPLFVASAWRVKRGDCLGGAGRCVEGDGGLAATEVSCFSGEEGRIVGSGIAKVDAETGWRFEVCLRRIAIPSLIFSNLPWRFSFSGGRSVLIEGEGLACLCRVGLCFLCPFGLDEGEDVGDRAKLSKVVFACLFNISVACSNC